MTENETNNVVISTPVFKLPVAENIPQELKDLKQWVLWSYQHRGEEKKLTKIPYQIRGWDAGRRKAETNNPQTWGTFEDAYFVLKGEEMRGKYDGLGFVFSENDNYVGVDVDHVYNPETRALNLEALEEVNKLSSYAEYSPSKTGAHVIVKGTKPAEKCRSDNWEMYQAGRYFTFTGERIEDTPAEINEAPDAIKDLYNRRINTTSKASDKSPGTRTQEEKGKYTPSPTLSDEEVIDLCKIAVNRDKFKALYTNAKDTRVKKYPTFEDDSSADLALCGIITFYTQNFQQIDRIVKESTCYREKWDREDYKKATIESALSELKSTYQKKKQVVQEEISDKYSKEIIDVSKQILEEGDPLLFMLETWNLRHIGDRNIGENCLCSVASTYILTSERGLHIKPSGASGKGKSDGMDEVLRLVPTYKFISGSMSSKALFYDPNLKAGTIIYADDAKLNDETIATIRQSTSKFQEETQHRTVVNQVAKKFDIPARCSFWFSSVDGISDDQLANRFLHADVDESPEQDRRVYEHIQDKESQIYEPLEDDILICRCMFELLGDELYVIKIPFAHSIEWRNIDNRRNFSKFLDIVKAVTFFNVKQRRKIGNTYLSTVEDFDRAVDIYTGTSKNNATNLTAQEIKVLRFITEKNKYDNKGKMVEQGAVTIKQLMSFLNVSWQRVKTVLEGNDGKGGMLAKVANLNRVDSSTITGGEGGSTSTRETKYSFYGKKIGIEIYDSVAVMDYQQAQEEEERFIETLSNDNLTNSNPTLTPLEVRVKTGTLDRIKSNLTKKGDNERGENNSSLSSCDRYKKAEINFKSHSDKKGYSGENNEGTEEQDNENDSNPPEVREGYSGVREEQDNENDLSLENLCQNALIKLATSSDYNKVVPDMDIFLKDFNSRTPEYKDKMTGALVLSLAYILNARGWKLFSLSPPLCTYTT